MTGQLYVTGVIIAAIVGIPLTLVLTTVLRRRERPQDLDLGFYGFMGLAYVLTVVAWPLALFLWPIGGGSYLVACLLRWWFEGAAESK